MNRQDYKLAIVCEIALLHCYIYRYSCHSIYFTTLYVKTTLDYKTA